MKDLLSLQHFTVALAALYLIGLCECAPSEEDAFTCKSAGKFAHQDPTKYHQCLFVGDNAFTHQVQNCPVDNCFKAKSQSCEFTDGECMQEVGGSISSFNCPDTGKFPHPDKSRTDSYMQCKKIHGKFYYQEYRCPPTKPCFSPHKEACELRDPCN